MVANAGAKPQESEEEKAARVAKDVQALEDSFDVNPQTGEVVKRDHNAGLSDDTLRDLDSLEGIQSALGGMPIAQATDLGTGFAVLDKDQKRRLVGVPLMFLFWNFNNGDQGMFVSAHVVQLDMTGKVVGKFIINDGSTGIRDQLASYTERTGSTKGLLVAKGLRASDYTYTDEDGKEKPATTFYIDTSPAA